MGERHELKQSQKNFKTSSGYWNQADSMNTSQEQKFLSVLHFLFVKQQQQQLKKNNNNNNNKKKTALVSYALPEKYKDTNKEKTQSVHKYVDPRLVEMEIDD